MTGNAGGANECWGTFDGNEPGPSGDGFDAGGTIFNFVARENTPAYRKVQTLAWRQIPTRVMHLPVTGWSPGPTKMVFSTTCGACPGTRRRLAVRLRPAWTGRHSTPEQPDAVKHTRLSGFREAARAGAFFWLACTTDQEYSHPFASRSRAPNTFVLVSFSG